MKRNFRIFGAPKFVHTWVCTLDLLDVRSNLLHMNVQVCSIYVHDIHTCREVRGTKVVVVVEGRR
jgi:hypothetical protein